MVLQLIVFLCKEWKWRATVAPLELRRCNSVPVLFYWKCWPTQGRSCSSNVVCHAWLLYQGQIYLNSCCLTSLKNKNGPSQLLKYISRIAFPCTSTIWHVPKKCLNCSFISKGGMINCVNWEAALARTAVVKCNKDQEQLWAQFRKTTLLFFLMHQQTDFKW